MTDPGEKAARATQFWGTSNPTSTGAPGTAGNTSEVPGEVSSSSNVFGTQVSQATGSSGTSGGQGHADSKTVSHTAYSEDSDAYTTVSGTGSTAPVYKPIVGEYPTDNGAGHGNLLIGGRKPNHGA